MELCLVSAPTRWLEQLRVRSKRFQVNLIFHQQKRALELRARQIGMLMVMRQSLPSHSSSLSLSRPCSSKPTYSA